ncbi:MAG: hypothetical protein OXG33_13055 [Chloroflexi bacterium]|nr:hypothetical protein [Chloroflexota bacterium]
MLFVTHDVDGDVVHQPVLVKRGEAGTTTLAENVAALPKERYRVEKYSISDPADVDGDCVDDLTELDDLGTKNPVNPAPVIQSSDGAVAIPDDSEFTALAFSEKFLKFVITETDNNHLGIYFIDSKTHQVHTAFLDAVDLSLGDVVLGDIEYNDSLIATDGSHGLYLYRIRTGSLGPNQYPLSVAQQVHALLAASVPLVTNNLGFHIQNNSLRYFQSDLTALRGSRIPLLFDEDVYEDRDFLPLNTGLSYGRLRVIDLDERPHPREIIVLEALPNNLPRVAGIITTLPQTPLSHVNLRAVQDGVPNAFIRNILDRPRIRRLDGHYVRLTVAPGGWSLQEATRAEVDAHYAASRPARTQTPKRDLSVKTITALSDIGFADFDAFGVKAANVAEVRKLGFPAGTVPNGFAIPFYFYDEFMSKTPLGEATLFGKRSGPEDEKFTLAADVKLIDAVKAILAHTKFQTDFDVQDEMLDDLRDAIKDADSPQWIIDALTAMHATFPEGQSLRYRSSTNNEDLPGFNGAGLYDSYTQHPDETEEDGIDKSLKQVFASLWNFRAFGEREFHRIDHLAAAMGVLVHPNYTDEMANGVAVSFDPSTGTYANYYVNTQLGEDLVTNPEAQSVPEEGALGSGGSYRVLATSNLVLPGELLLSEAQLSQLRRHLEAIHDHFEGLYNPAPGDPFAMEIEFKITSENVLAIKQARPWVFGHESGGSDGGDGSDDGGGDDGGGNGGGGGDGSGGGGSGGGGGGGGGGAPGPAPAPVTRQVVVGGTPSATATELSGNRLLIQRHDVPDADFELAIGAISADCARIGLAGVIRDGFLGQTYVVVRRDADGQIVRHWVAPDSPLVYQIPWPVVNTQYTLPVDVVSAIPMDDQCPQPNLLVRRFDGGDDRIFAYDAVLRQWRHVPDIPTFQALGFYWCNVTAADAAFFERITHGPAHPISATPARDDYPNCLTS